MSLRVSAGILLYRRLDGEDHGIEVLLAHPGGPFFKERDLGDWTIPKGEPNQDEPLRMAAWREFAEETGTSLDSRSAAIELGSIVQKGGKVVHAWAVQGDLEPEAAASDTFEMEWPPRSGRIERFPEIDRVAWFEPGEARRRIKPTQVPFIERLEETLLG
jgi:predicted NUDIX family NTP pyrophosphohydrolase